MSESKQIHIIAGANGSGKTTKAEILLPEGFLATNEFVNADNIARGISPYNFNSKSVAFQAGEQMLRRMENLIKAEQNFAFETTLSGKSYVNLVKKCQNLGYLVNLIFLYTNNPALNVERVKDRVRQGGHGVEQEIIERRYYRGINNLINCYLPIVDNAVVIDGSNIALDSKRDKIMEKSTAEITIFKPDIWEILLTISKTK